MKSLPYLNYYAKKELVCLAVTVCWMLTFLIGYEAFFFQDDLFTVTLIGKFSPVFNFVLASLLLIIPVGIFYMERKLLFFIFCLVLFTFFYLLDVNRLTPYFHCYLGLFAILSFYRDHKSLEKALLIFAMGVYLFSGLNKFNDFFADHILARIWFYSLPLSPTRAVGNAAAAIEVCLGFALLFQKTRKLACVFLIGMHLILLWKLGPLKLYWNLIVWPWNVAMISILIFLFKSESRLAFRGVFSKESRGLILVVFFFFVLPLFSFFNLAPENLGFKLYSGKSLSYDLQVSSKIVEFSEHDQSTNEETTLINLQKYAIEERQLAINPEPWIYEEIAENFKYIYKSNAVLIPIVNYGKNQPEK